MLSNPPGKLELNANLTKLETGFEPLVLEVGIVLDVMCWLPAGP